MIRNIFSTQDDDYNTIENDEENTSHIETRETAIIDNPSETVLEAKVETEAEVDVKRAKEVAIVRGEPSPFLVHEDNTTTITDEVFLKRITEYIEKNLHTQSLAVNDLCNYMGVTQLVLNKKLKLLINMTANSLIRTIRLQRAAELLKTTRYTIADVTYDVGFNDLRYFRECFKKEFDMLPQEYKNKYAEETDIAQKGQPTTKTNLKQNEAKEG